MSEKKILVWFRNDLRIHDNEMLSEAVEKASTIIPVYCFDPRYYVDTCFSTQKTGNFRVKFILESVIDLKSSLKKLGGDLLIFTGKPKDILPRLCEKYGIDEVYHHREVASEETTISSNVEDALWKLQINLKHFIGHTMHHKEDLPFPIKHIPDVFVKFRKKIEREGVIRSLFDSPKHISVPENLESSVVPTLEDLGFDEAETDTRAVLDFKGGETEALNRLQRYLWDSNSLLNQKSSPSEIRGGSHSSKLSPWLASGCISPRAIYWEIKRYEKERGANESTSLLFIELLWRDYFRFMFKKHGTRFFIKSGFKDKIIDFASNQKELFNKWKTAKTGVPFIDAHMRELNLTGFLSNQGRQHVASYLIKDLNVNWTWGAAYFEEKLIDYSPSSNWGNWAYLAGGGNDPIKKTLFSIEKQAAVYDPNGEYVSLWLDQ